MRMTKNEERGGVSEVRHILWKLGGTPNYSGFHYLQYGIGLVLEEEECLLAITKELYPEIARHYHTTCGSVERSIRKMIAVMWEKNPEFLEKMAGYPLRKRPTVGEFMGLLSLYCSNE